MGEQVEAICDSCGEAFDTALFVYDGDEFKCPGCGSLVVAVVDEDGGCYWNTWTSDGKLA